MNVGTAFWPNWPAHMYLYTFWSLWCMYMHVWCMYMDGYGFMCIIYIYMWICIWIYARVCVYAYVYVCACMCLPMSGACMCMYLCACMSPCNVCTHVRSWRYVAKNMQQHTHIDETTHETTYHNTLMHMRISYCISWASEHWWSSTLYKTNTGPRTWHQVL